MTLIDDYLEYQEKYSKIYGSKAVVFMQVGSFHEAYSTATEGFNLKELEPILNLKFTRRDGGTNKSADRKNPHLLGFPSISVAKYISIMTENGYTVVLFDQVRVTSTDSFDRKLTGIFSPGTHISDRMLTDANYILSVYIVEERQLLSDKTLHAIGLTLVDVTTGESIVHEFYGNKTDEKFGLDELVRIIQSFNPTETVIYYHPIEVNEETIKSLKAYLELNDTTSKFYVYHNKKGSDVLNLLIEPMFKINYQNDFLAKIFDFKYQLTLSKKQSPIEVLDLERKPYVIISLMVMLRYISEHNINLLQNLSHPTIYVYNKHLVLGNNAIQQLNVIDSNKLDSYDRRTESLFDVVNQNINTDG